MDFLSDLRFLYRRQIDEMEERFHLARSQQPSISSSLLWVFFPRGRHLLYIAATSRRRTTSYPLVSSELLL